MSWIVTAEECREMDHQAEALGVTVEQLMHEAGRAVASCVLENYPNAGRIAVVCGKGNNGGDGLVAARLLAERQLGVDVFIASTADELGEHASRECGRLKEVSLKPRFCSDKDWVNGSISLRVYDLIVDALLGTGLNGPPSGSVAKAIHAINKCGKPVVSVDIPSGVECDTGAVCEEAVYASNTVTFGLPKPYLFQGEGMVHAGHWSVDSIGFPEELLQQRRHAAARLVNEDEVRHFMPKRSKLTNKHSQGSLLVVAGSQQMPGAAVLCARGALRGGAGLVTVASIPSVCDVVSKILPEAILLPLKENDGAIDASAAETLASRSNDYIAVVVGPGLSLAPGISDFLSQIFKVDDWKFCVDADALTWVSRGVELPPYVFGGNCVLTPHEGELARLLGIESADVQRDRFNAARLAVSKLHKVVVLKGAHTIIASTSGLVVNTTGNPGLAAAGTGDVLSGLIGSVLLRHDPWESAVLGAYWHGLAGDICAREIGPAGFLASELADRLPKARATISSACE